MVYRRIWDCNVVCNIFTPEGPHYWKLYDLRETSDAPQRISNRAAITLEGLDYPQRCTSLLRSLSIFAPDVSYLAALHPLVLAEGFNLTSGSQIIKVPDIIEPGKFRYRITRESVLVIKLSFEFIAWLVFQYSVIREIIARTSRSLQPSRAPQAK